MGWVRIDNNFWSHPKFANIGGDAGLLLIGLIAYCDAHLTDGAAPYAALSLLAHGLGIGRDGARDGVSDASRDAITDLVDRLVARNLITIDGVPPDASVIVHDYLGYQESREAILLARQRNRERNQAYRDRRRSAARTVCDTITRSERDGVNDVSRDGVSDVSRPSGLVMSVSPYPNQSDSEGGLGGDESRRPSTRPCLPPFDRFWGVVPVPRQVNRNAAQREWRLLTYVERERAIRGMQQQAAWPRYRAEGWQYMADPHRWLRDRRWADKEPGTPRGARSSRNLAAAAEAIRRKQGGSDEG